MRILFVLTSLGIGGAERQVIALANHMADRGHEVALMVLRPQLAEQWPTALNTSHLGMRKNPITMLAAMARGRRFLADFQPDLIHSHSFHANIAARLLKLLWPRLAVLSTVHNVFEGGWGRMLAYRLTDGLACRTTFVGRKVMARFVRLKAVSLQKCVLVTNGIDTGEFSPRSERREAKRAEMDAATGFIWLTAGRIAPAKDYPNLLRAFQRVLELRSSARLWIAGEPVGAEASAVQALAATLGLDASVRWLGLRRDLPALLDAADGFVLASAWEGMPLAVGEAMAMEKLVVATDVGSVRELMGNTGLLVPPKSPEALASAMLEVMRQTLEIGQISGRAARHRIVHEFSMDSRADEWEVLYQALLETGH